MVAHSHAQDRMLDQMNEARAEEAQSA